jgi:hypothetical protein
MNSEGNIKAQQKALMFVVQRHWVGDRVPGVRDSLTSIGTQNQAKLH